MLKVKLHLVILILYTCVCVTDTVESKPKLFLVFLFDIEKEGVVGTGERMAGAIIKSVNQAQEILPEFDLSDWEIIDTGCLAAPATARLLKLWKRMTDEGKRIHGIIGPYCAFTCKIAALFASAYNIPVVSNGCYFEQAGDEKFYPTLARVNGDMTLPIKTIMMNLIASKNIEKLAIVVNPDVGVTVDVGSNIEKSIRDFVNKEYKIDMIETLSRALSRTDPGDIGVDLIHKLLDTKRKGFEVFYLATMGADALHVLKVAFSIGMMDGSILFITTHIRFPEGMDRPNYPQLNIALMLAENGLLTINYAEPQSADYQDFMQELTDIEKHFDDPRLQQFKPSRTFTADQLHIGAALAYDAVTLWAKGMKEALQFAWPTDGRSIIEQLPNINFQGLTGQIALDVNRSRRLDWILQVVQNNGTLVTIGDYLDKEERLTINNTALKSITWANGVKEMPGASTKEPLSLLIWIIIGCVLCLMTLGFCFLCLLYRRFQSNLESQKTSAWLIQWDDIKLINHYKDKSGPRLSIVSRSHHSVGSGSLTTTGIESFESFDSSGLTDYGFYQDRKIVVKLSHLTTLDMRDDRILLEFIKLRKLHHVNINSFIGVCVEPNHICICMSYCSKGSVWNVIEKRSFSMTWHFRMSLAVDIATGMAYLHESAIGSHGHLTSTNCVIDSSWTCKITDYGLCYMRRRHSLQQRQQQQRRPSNKTRGSVVVVDDENASDDRYFLWTAPELLRLVPEKRPLCGTKKADVFSYGIILQEICFQQKPFGILLEEYGASEVMSRVKRAEKPPFRPVEPEDKVEMAGDKIIFNNKWMDLMRACWAEKPEERLKFHSVLERLSGISGGQTIHAIDSMVKMLEVHTVRLENSVHETSQELYEQKQKADSLLYSILPKVIAEQLKQGTKVLPEYFEAVTIFVSDIVAFTPLAAASSPVQMVTFLGMLYNMFDEFIERNDVYKVETSGDSYVVASGLPTRNGNAHASEIATFSLQLLDSILSFKIPHMQDKVLEIRIGLHSGPVLAGVVGQKMPRYCLFGHTVSTAYLMEASSPANSIHVSDTTYKLLKGIGTYKLVEHSKIDYEGKQGMQTYRLLEGSKAPPAIA